MPDISSPLPVVPRETFYAAHKIYNIHNIYLQIGDHLEEIFSTVRHSKLDITSSLSNDTIARLSLVTTFQFAEALPDTYAAEASLTRMDWKYALHLPLYHPGIPPAALCSYRQNLYSSPAAIEEFETFLSSLRKCGLYARFSYKSSYALEVLTMVCNINRLFLLHQAMQSALSVLVSAAPTWLRSNIRPHWYEHYQAGRTLQSLNLAAVESQVEASRLGSDIQWLLHAIDTFNNSELAERREILELKQLMEDQFIQTHEDISWRRPGCASCAINH